MKTQNIVIDKKSDMRESWIKWTLLESVARSSSRLLQKLVGASSSTLGQTFFAAMLIGVVQTISGFAVVRLRKKAFLDNYVHVLGAMTFGIFAFIATVLGFIVFLMHGEVGVSTFIVTLAIVPGTLIDRIIFKKVLSIRQYLGILIAICAGYSILNAPSLKEFLNLPLWIWLSVLNMLVVAANQGVTKKIKDMDPFVKNFWGGLMAVILGVITLLFVPLSSVFQFPEISKIIWVSLIIGFLVIAVWSFNLLSYKAGAFISLKNLVMNGSYLFFVMIAGVLIFNENITVLKVLGFALYMIAFMFVDNSAWKVMKEICLSCTKRLTSKHHS